MVATLVTCFTCGRPLAEYIKIYNYAVDKVTPKLSINTINESVIVQDLLDSFEMLSCCRMHLTTTRSSILNYKE